MIMIFRIAGSWLVGGGWTGTGPGEYSDGSAVSVDPAANAEIAGSGRPGRHLAHEPTPAFKLGSLGTDCTPMRLRRFLQSKIALLACLAGTSGCISNDGTPVYVDYGALEVWSGKGMLLEVSPDQTQCRVVVRDENLIRRELWVDCIHVHPRRGT